MQREAIPCHNLFRWFALQPEFGCQHRPSPCTTIWDSVAEHLLSLIRILIADDFEAWRREVCLLLRRRPELQVVCEASDGSEAVQKADDLKPDLIVLDIGLPKLNGIEAARRIRQLSPNSKILFLSQNNDLAVVQAALGTGALGYVYKMNAQKELLSAVDAVLLGKQFVGSGLTGRN
jgi:DNA-binding NarL/FixJ family response regulator